jgi:hypothetical protein
MTVVVHFAHIDYIRRCVRLLLMMSCLNCLSRPSTSNKKVTFDKKVIVYYYKPRPIETNVCWPQVARDRMRFKRHTLDIEQRISWVFTQLHRDRVYNKLYM